MFIPLFAFGWPEAVIILIVVLVLFGGSRLAGVGKGVGRSIREFKDEVSSDPKKVEASETRNSEEIADSAKEQ